MHACCSAQTSLDIAPQPTVHVAVCRSLGDRVACVLRPCGHVVLVLLTLVGCFLVMLSVSLKSELVVVKILYIITMLDIKT